MLLISFLVGNYGCRGAVRKLSAAFMRSMIDLKPVIKNKTAATLIIR